MALRAFLAVVGVIVVGLIAGLVLGFGSWGFLAIELLAIAALAVIDRRGRAIDRWIQGAEGEEQVGQVLERLRDFGWHVLHDVDMGRGNVDHILVGPAGVLTVETKSHAGRVYAPGIDEKMLRQAYAQAMAVSERCEVEAAPLLVFSQAYLYPRPVSRQRGVVVLPARMLAAHLERRKARFTAEQAREVYARLATSLSSV